MQPPDSGNKGTKVYFNGPGQPRWPPLPCIVKPWTVVSANDQGYSYEKKITK